MRTHTSQFKDEIKQYGRQFNDTIYYNNTTYDGEHIFSVNYSVDTTLCKSVMQTLTIDTDISMNVGNTLDYGISVENATDEIRFNNFIVNKIEEQKDKKSSLVTCYDNMIKSMKDYESLGVTYPITIRDYLSAICTKLGLTFKNASDTFTNYDKNITSEHYIDTDGNSMGYTFRDVLDDIAEAVGGFICIDSNGQLEIRDITQAVGKNLFNSTKKIYFYFDSSHTRTKLNQQYRTTYIKIEPNTTYTISKLRSSRNWIGTSHENNPTGTYNVYNITNMSKNTTYDGTTRVSGTITTGNDDKYLLINYCDTNIDGSYQNDIFNSIQLELGNQATDFEPYGDTINEEYFSDKNVNIGKKIGPYNVVVLSRASDSDNIHYPATLPSNPIEFKISDNAILDQDNREDFIQGIYNKINGLEFYLNDFATTGILYYEIGDKYNVSIDNTTYTCLMLNDDIKRTTGLKENILTNEPKQSVTEFKYASSTDRLEKQSRNAVIKVDKANASIEQIVSAVGDNGQVTSASIIQSINNDTSQIKLEADKIDLNGAITANGNFIINQDGSVEVNSGKLSLKDSGVSNPAIQITSTVTNNKSRLSSEVISLTDATSTAQTEIHRNSYTVSSKNSSNKPQGAYIYPNDLGFSHWIEDGNGNDVRVANFTRGKDNGNALELLYTGTTNFSVTNNSTGSDMLLNGNATINGETIVDSIRTKNIFSSSLQQGSYGWGDGNKYNSGYYVRFEIPVKPNTTYTVSWQTSKNISELGALYFNGNTFLYAEQNNTFTTPSNCNKIAFNIGAYPNALTPSDVYNIQVEEGSVATSYTPYQNLNAGDDTGWIECDLTSNFEHTGWDNLQYRRKNGHVTIGGAVKTKVSTSWTMVITTLPVGFRPPGEFDVVCRTSWSEVMKVAINPDGTIDTLNLNDGRNLPANEYIFITATYPVD